MVEHRPSRPFSKSGPATLAALAVLAGLTALRPPPPLDLPDISRPPGFEKMNTVNQEQFTKLQARLRTLLKRRAPAAQLARAYGELGMWHMTYSFPDTARRCLETAERLQPSETAWPFYLGRSLARQGETREAEEAYERVLALQPEDVTDLVLLAETEMRVGKLPEARFHLERALARAPNTVRAWVRLGQIAREEGRLERAALLLERALARLPRHPEVRYSLGLVYRDQGRLEKAEQLLALGHVNPGVAPELPLPDPRTDALVARQTDALTFNAEGIRASRAGRLAEAAESFRRAVAVGPDEPTYRTNLARTLDRLGRREEAVEELQEALRRSPDSAAIHFAFAIVLQRENPRQAEEHLRTALRLDPRHAEAHALLGRILRAEGRLAEAASHLGQAVALDPTRPAWRTLLIVTLEAAGRPSEALSVAEQSVQALPDRPQLLMLEVRLLAGIPGLPWQERLRALAAARQLFAGQRTLAAAETVAFAYAGLGRFDEAMAWQKAALEAARSVGREHELPWLAERLGRYRARQRPRALWAPGEPESRTAGLWVEAPTR